MNDEESELSDYPGEEDMDGMDDMDMADGEDAGEDGGEEMDGDLGETGQISPTQTSPDRESDDNNKSENIRNFMHQAQPAAGIMDPSPQMQVHRVQDSNDPTHEKEGGSVEDPSSRPNPYANDTESSPEITRTDAEPSAYIDGEEGFTSSLQDTPLSPDMDQNQQDLNNLDDPNLIQNLNKKAQQITDHLMKMKQA